MTWTLKASGHHSTVDWFEEEYELLRKMVAAAEQGATVVTHFYFSGNHVTADSLPLAKFLVEQFDASCDDDKIDLKVPVEDVPQTTDELLADEGGQG